MSLASNVGGDEVWTHVMDTMEVHESSAMTAGRVLKAEMLKAKAKAALFVLGKIILIKVGGYVLCCRLCRFCIFLYLTLMAGGSWSTLYSSSD
mmetsp:Transcript_10981/g.15717  ORF Transcript_10981/g.15717 Transcript_10981/m.15717 type:complete len:93 (-) Transcript_10981:125-403(-)